MFFFAISIFLDFYANFVTYSTCITSSLRFCSPHLGSVQYERKFIFLESGIEKHVKEGVDVLCAFSEYRPKAKWNLFVLYNNQDISTHFVSENHIN